MTIRAAEQGDWSGIAAIWNPIIRDTALTFTTLEKTEAGLSQQISELPCFLVAEDGGQVLGFALFGQFRGGPGYARTMELTIHLAPEAHGRGLGRALIAELEAEARRQGVGSLWAGIGHENPASVTFHERLGFEQVAVLPRVGFKFGRWMDLVLMRKWIADDAGVTTR